ncbi:MAG: HPr family phosphocarrier protein [Candidatus Omnitrophica bacterium]|nr:HPr family phosphocarrier protein [Candidatus Omnitrophota bacterium]
MDPVQTAEKKFVIRSKLGLHARPAALFVRTANRFRSDVTIQKGKHKVNGKSIMGVMMLAAGPGSHITVRIVGPDAERAMDEIEKLIDSNFGEKD